MSKKRKCEHIVLIEMPMDGNCLTFWKDNIEKEYVSRIARDKLKDGLNHVPWLKRSYYPRFCSECGEKLYENN